MPTLHELHRNVFTGQRFDEAGLQGIADGSVWSIDGPATINNSSDTAFSISTKSTWSTLVVQNTDTTEDQSMDMADTGLGIALKGHDSIGGIAHITTDTNKGRTSIISSTDASTASTYRESLTVSPEGYIGIGQITPTAVLNTKGTLDAAFAGAVTVPKVGTITGVTIVAGGTGFGTGSLVFDNTGAGGTGAAGTYTVDGDGAINSTTITNAGSGYTSLPTVNGDAAGANETLTAVSDATVTTGGFTLSCTTTVSTITVRTADTSTLALGMTVSGTGIPTVAATIATIPSSTTFTLASFTLTCTTSNGAGSVTTSDTSMLLVGMSVSGTGIPNGSTIGSIDTALAFSLASSGTATASGTVTLTFGAALSTATSTLTFLGHGIRAGDAVSLASGTGGALENFTVSSVANTTQFTIDNLPTNALSSSPAASNKRDSNFVKIESGDGNSLLVIDKTGHIGIGGNPRSSLDVDSTDAIVLPSGIATQAPGGTASQIGTAIAGMMRFDSTAEAFKGYDGSSWITLGVSGIQDSDGDTKIDPEVTGDADDLVFYTDGSIRMTIDQSGVLTYGASGAGTDAKFWGATSGKYMLWDASADKMIITGAADITEDLNVTGDVYTDIIRRKSDNTTTTKIRLHAGDVQIHAGNSSNSILRVRSGSPDYVTVSGRLEIAADSNIGIVGDTDLMTLASGLLTVAGEISVTTLDIGGTNVTTTAAELNLIDGGTARGTDAIADGDGVLINDAGTMKMTTVQTLSAYLDDEITSMPNLTTAESLTAVSALNSGSITSGFTSIDIGSGNLTATGTTTVTGSLIIPNQTTNPSSLDADGQIVVAQWSGNRYLVARIDGNTYKVQIS